MPKIHGPLDDNARKITGERLQSALIDLIDLSLVAKQAHWNVIGSNFRSVHLQLDQLVSGLRGHMDTLAERAVTIGTTPDGRSATVASDTQIPQPDPGYLRDDKVIAAITDALSGVVERFRGHTQATAEPDPVTQDLLIAAAQDLEQQHWMFEAMR